MAHFPTSSGRPTWRATVLTLFPGDVPRAAWGLARRPGAGGRHLVARDRRHPRLRPRPAPHRRRRAGRRRRRHGHARRRARPPPSTTRVRASRMRRSSTCRRADEPFDQTLARELAAGPGVLLLAGRFEGIDERVIAGRGMREVSIGDYVLSGGELAAMVLLDACVRLLPGVVGAEESLSAGELRGGPARVPAVHQAARMGGPGDPRRPPVRRPQEGRRVAPQGGRASHCRAPPGSCPAQGPDKPGRSLK